VPTKAGCWPKSERSQQVLRRPCKAPRVTLSIDHPHERWPLRRRRNTQLISHSPSYSLHTHGQTFAINLCSGAKVCVSVVQFEETKPAREQPFVSYDGDPPATRADLRWIHGSIPFWGTVPPAAQFATGRDIDHTHAVPRRVRQGSVNRP